MGLVAALAYWVIVVLGTVVFFYVRNPRAVVRDIGLPLDKSRR